MKRLPLSVFLVISVFLISIFLFNGCSQNTLQTEKIEISLILDQFGAAYVDGNVDHLITYFTYSRKCFVMKNYTHYFITLIMIFPLFFILIGCSGIGLPDIEVPITDEEKIENVINDFFSFK
ncbi:MAG: hypothetical protein ABIK21_06745 [bacterium]